MKPTEKEYAKYYQPYIEAVEGEDLIKELNNSSKALISFFNALDPSKLDYRYDTDKWTPKEILMHLIDTERVFVYRALRFSRGDTTNLNGFDHNQYVIAANTDQRSLTDLLEEFKAVRGSTIHLFKNMAEADMLKVGMANNNITSCRALGFVTVGHQNHHIKVIKEKYL